MRQGRGEKSKWGLIMTVKTPASRSMVEKKERRKCSTSLILDSAIDLSPEMKEKKKRKDFQTTKEKKKKGEFGAVPPSSPPSMLLQQKRRERKKG